MPVQRSFDDLLGETPALEAVPGLTLCAEFITASDEDALAAAIDSAPWMLDLQRRVQHYGYRYDYRARTATREMALGPLPAWASALGRRLCADGYFDAEPDQVIVNEYEPGQGIADHTDCRPCFGPTVATLSLLSACVMDFKDPGSGDHTSQWLRPRDLLVMRPPVRDRWTHGIRKRKVDKLGSVVARRSRRLSITFRTMQLEDG